MDHVKEIQLNEAFFRAHPVELLDSHGACIARFSTFQCAARSAAWRSDRGRPTNLSARNVLTGEQWSYKECIRWHNAHLPADNHRAIIGA